MHILFEIYEFRDDEVPEEKREWWSIRKTALNKEALIKWAQRNKRQYARYKIGTTDAKIKDFFYPLKELKSNSQTGKFLRQTGFTVE